MADYPARNSFFAHDFVRIMTRACAAQEIGSDAFVLLTVIVHTEDARKYSGPVTFWNDQLQSVLGFSSWGKLDRARKRAVDAGWLHYECGGKGKVGKYWVTIPGGLQGLRGHPVDEDHPIILSENGETNQLSSPPLGENRGTSGERTEGEPGENRGTSGEHSTLTRTLPRNSTSRKLRFTDEDMETAHWMHELNCQLYPDSNSPQFNKWANGIRLMRERDHRTIQQIRELYTWAHHDEFWHKNILCPATLRRQWDKLQIKRNSQTGSGRPMGRRSPARDIGWNPDATGDLPFGDDAGTEPA